MFKKIVSVLLVATMLLTGTVVFAAPAGDLIVPYASRSYQYLLSVDNGNYLENDGLTLTCDASTSAVTSVDKIGMSAFTLQRWTGSRWNTYGTRSGKYATYTSGYAGETSLLVSSKDAGTNFRWMVTHYVKEGAVVETYVSYSNEVWVQ